MQGTDVASYQTGIDYARARDEAGIRFVIVKTTDGGSYVNPEAHAQINAAFKAGLCLGYYLFWRQEWGDTYQAAHFWRVTQPYWAVGERIALDVEQPDDDPTPLPPDTADRVYVTLCEMERLSGVTPELYINRDLAARYFNDPRFARFGLWLAAWGTVRPAAPPPWDRITIWQHSGGAQIPGIGWADGDEFDGTPEDWRGVGATVQPQQPGGAMMEPVITERTDWGGAGVIIEESVIVQNTETKYIYTRSKVNGVMGEWEMIV